MKNPELFENVQWFQYVVLVPDLSNMKKKLTAYDFEYVGFKMNPYLKKRERKPSYLLVVDVNPEEMFLRVIVYENTYEKTQIKKEYFEDQEPLYETIYDIDFDEDIKGLKARYGIPTLRVIDKIEKDYGLKLTPIAQKTIYNTFSYIFKRRDEEIQEATKEVFESVHEEDELFEEKDSEDVLFSKNKSDMKKHSQDYSGYYSRGLPDPEMLQQYIGTSGVDVSDIIGKAGGDVVNDAVSLVNQYNASLLSDVAMIFDFSNASAYGVYIPKLDQEIKQSKIKKMLEGENIQVQDLPQGGFTAFSPEKSPEEVQEHINFYESQLEGVGGSLFGVNMNKTFEAAAADLNTGGMTQDDLKDLLTIHLGATMVHEAVHSMGEQTEGPSESEEINFINFAIPIINSNRETEGRPPLYANAPMAAAANSWYGNSIRHQAQFGAQFMLSVDQPSTGWGKPAPWSAIFWDGRTAPIENMLGAHHQGDSPIMESTERLLRLKDRDANLRGVEKDQHLESALEEDRDETEGYKLTENLIDERREKPLAFINKNASLKKQAAQASSYFGWMNNLDLPMRERIDEWDEGDGWLKWNWDNESWFNVRNQFRYNPEYDDKGFGYRWVEPRFQPELFDRMLARRPSHMISPARRFASDEQELKRQSDTFLLISVLNRSAAVIKADKIYGTRFLISDDIDENITEYVGDVLCEDGDMRWQSCGCEKKNLKSYWLVNSSIDEKSVNDAEKYVRGNNSYEEIFDYICGYSSIKKEIIETVLDAAKKICEKSNIKNIFIAGDFPRSLAMNESWKNIKSLEFVGRRPKQCMILGELLGKKLKAENYKTKHAPVSLTWEWMGVKCRFEGPCLGKQVCGLRRLMEENGIDANPVNMNVYARGFTIDMMLFDIKTRKIYDVSRSGKKDIESKLLKTALDPIEILGCEKAIEALRLASRYNLEIDPSLKNAVHQILGNINSDELEQGKEKILNESIKRGMKLLKEYGLDS